MLNGKRFSSSEIDEKFSDATILDTIEGLVLLQKIPVHYKWVSYQFSLPVSRAKSILAEFVQLHPLANFSVFYETFLVNPANNSIEYKILEKHVLANVPSNPAYLFSAVHSICPHPHPTSDRCNTTVLNSAGPDAIDYCLRNPTMSVDITPIQMDVDMTELNVKVGPDEFEVSEVDIEPDGFEVPEVKVGPIRFEVPEVKVGSDEFEVLEVKVEPDGFVVPEIPVTTVTKKPISQQRSISSFFKRV